MAEEIEVWALDDSSNAKTLESVNQTETEQKLEDALAANSALLMPDLTIVGRQASTESGYPDLLGLDSDGRLVVFELKRGTLTREAVAQVLDYGSDLEARTELELARYIADNSGRNGVEEIEDFEVWYRDRFGEELMALKPVKMILVGLGVDDKAQRMVEFLAERRINIRFIAFHGFRYQDEVFLVKKSEQPEDRNIGVKTHVSTEEQKRGILTLAKEKEVKHWNDAIETLKGGAVGSPTRRGITFYRSRITLPKNVRVAGSHSVAITDEPTGSLKVTFYPAAVDVCWEEFNKRKEAVPFKFEKPRNAPPTERVSEQWYCILNAADWETHKEALQELVALVHREWAQY